MAGNWPGALLNREKDNNDNNNNNNNNNNDNKEKKWKTAFSAVVQMKLQLL